MTRYSKILVIFLAVASLAFAGFAVATTFGGPDWRALMEEEAFAGYKISRSAGENPVWSAVRADGTTVGTSVRLPEVLVKVLDDIEQRRQQEIQKLAAREPLLKERIELLNTSLVADEEALKQGEAQQREQLAKLREEEIEVGKKVVAATGEAQKLENIIASRREDILRLRQQVELLKADQYRLNENLKQLTNLRIQLEKRGESG